MLHHALILKESSLEGLGLFATVKIAAGELIWYEEMTYPKYHRDVILSWPPAQREFFLRYSFSDRPRVACGAGGRGRAEGRCVQLHESQLRSQHLVRG